MFFSLPAQQKHADAICIGVTGNKREGDRRKPRERRRSPKSRRVGGAGKASVLHPPPQRGRQTVEHLHQAVERRHALSQAKGRHARPTQGDRRKPRERRRSPKSRRVGGAEKSSVLHPKA